MILWWAEFQTRYLEWFLWIQNLKMFLKTFISEEYLCLPQGERQDVWSCWYSSVGECLPSCPSLGFISSTPPPKRKEIWVAWERRQQGCRERAEGTINKGSMQNTYTGFKTLRLELRENMRTRGSRGLTLLVKNQCCWFKMLAQQRYCEFSHLSYLG